MDWKEFLKPTKIKFATLVILFILSIFFGFIRTDLMVNLCTGPDCPPQRECGVEGIFNPLLRPTSFVLANIVNNYKTGTYNSRYSKLISITTRGDAYGLFSFHKYGRA